MYNLRSPLQQHGVVMSLFTASAKRAINGCVNYYFKRVIKCICNRISS